MPEETKPDNMAFDKQILRDLGLPEDYVPRDENEAYRLVIASWDAALERAARTVESTIWCYNGAQANNVRECAEKIRALKGRGRCPIVI
jgi:hypothetical protein